jgi:pyroglutamyl-peptidase
MKLVLTGFEPFGESKINPSEQVVRALKHEKFRGIELYTTILPVDRERGPKTVIRAVERIKPDAVLCLGEAQRRMIISIERVAINLLDFRIADNAGKKIVDEPIVRDAPAAYFTTLPVRAMYDAVRQAGVPAELSLSAGAFLCNQVTYAVLHHIAENDMNIRAGFVHLPALPAQVVVRDVQIPSMSLDTMIVGICAAIRAIQQEMK